MKKILKKYKEVKNLKTVRIDKMSTASEIAHEIKTLIRLIRVEKQDIQGLSDQIE